ncbi:MAG TPA: DUF4907 domain-containing protein [Dyadobacter sp.]|nr:DUF4907 domain-containing protein [Dyadobacter sp.]
MKISNTLKVVLICLIAFAGAAYFYFSQRSKNEVDSTSEGFRNLRTETVSLPNGWGYRIMQDTSALIEQFNIPGVEGTNPFRNQQEAQSVADLVMNKLERKVFPPTVEIRELDSLKITYK